MAKAMCPICRAPVPRQTSFSVTVSLRNAIDRLFKDDAEYRKRKAEAHNPSAVAASTSGESTKRMHYSEAMWAAGRAQYAALLAALTNRDTFPEIDNGLIQQDFDCFVSPPPSLPTPEASMTFSTTDIGASPELREDLRTGMSRCIRTGGIYAESEPFLSKCTNTVICDVANIAVEVQLGTVSSPIQRRTVGSDVVAAVLSPHYTIPYGHGNVHGVRYILSPFIIRVLRQILSYGSISPDGLSIIHDMVVDVINRVVKLAIVHAHNGADITSAPGGNDVSYETRIPVPAGLATSEGELFSHDICVTMAVSDAVNRDNMRAGDRATIGEGGEIIRLCSILAGMSGVLANELRRHQIAEIQKAVNKLNEARPFLVAERLDRLGIESDLVFAPNVCALVVSHIHGIVLTVEAAVAVAAIAEYLSTQIIELSYNAAQEENASMIEPIHIDRAIRKDAELDDCFPADIISARCHDNAFLHSAALQESFLDLDKEFYYRLATLAQNVPGRIVVDPISGRHLQLEERITRFRRCHCTYLDAASALGAYERAQVRYVYVCVLFNFVAGCAICFVT